MRESVQNASSQVPSQTPWAGNSGDRPSKMSFIKCCGGLRSTLDLRTTVCMHAESLLLCPNLCGPMDCSPPASSVHGVLWARIPEWVVVPFSKRSSQSRDRTWVSWIAGRFFTIWASHQGSPSSLGQTSLHSASLYCALQTLQCLPVESTNWTLHWRSLWAPFSNSICWLSISVALW